MAAPDSIDDELLDDWDSPARIFRLVAREFGPEMASAFRDAHRLQEQRARQLRPDEGLRERKRRMTRQRISDVATTLFVARGFDNVTVAEIADYAGVSEKTAYNYFPTKEAMVLDSADENVERLASALRDRKPGESLTSVVVRATKEDERMLDEMPDALYEMFLRFRDMLFSTPPLRAAWLDLHNRLTDVTATELAASAEVDPRDPEPMIAARALVDLGIVAFESRIRHIEDGLRGRALGEAVGADIERAARLLETGLWSFNVLAQTPRTKQQLVEAAKTAQQASQQVVKALRQARAAFREVRAQQEAARHHGR
jgi:AcrR family transcriptional regulator